MAISPVFGQWTDQTSNITNDLEAVHFITANEGWAVGRQGKIIHTTNAGATWSSQNSGTTNDLNNVHMVNASFGVAVGDGGTVVKYNGSSWSTTSSGTSQDLYSVYFVDATTGWIGGDWAIIKKSTNGGSSFSSESTSALSNTFRDIHMFSATEGWAVGSTGSVFKYNGSGWNAFTNPYSGTGTGPDLYAVSFSGPNNGFATGENSSVIYFDGSSWTTHGTSLPDNSFHVYDVQAISDNLAYAVTTPGFGGQGYILKYDGNSWNTDYNYTGMNSELFTGVSFPTASKGYAVGSGGMIKTKGSAGGTASIEDNAAALALSVFPNPVTDKANVAYTLSRGGEVTISLYEMSGRLLSSERLQQSAGDQEYTLDGSFLPTGMYLVKVATAAGVATVSLVR
jgi:photosystem II stability/assembly factor-like uncharacterized protein